MSTKEVDTKLKYTEREVWWMVEAQIEKLLLGKVLTIIDASYTDVTQRDAVKSLIKEKFHDQIDWMLQRKTGKAGSDESN